MATSNESFVIPGLTAAADLSAKQFHFVKIVGDHQVNVCSMLGELAVGVLRDKPSTVGEAASVASEGVEKVVAGAAITAGAQITTMANGRAQTAGTGHEVQGIALEAATADGQIITVKLNKNGLAA